MRTVGPVIRNDVPRVLQLAPWVAGLWAATFLGLSLLALLGRVPHAWTPDAATPLGQLTAAQMSWLVGVLAVVVLVALVAGTTSLAPARVRTSGRVLLVVGLLVAVLVSDVRALAALGYLPQILLALADLGPGAGHLRWSLLTEDAVPLAHAVGGLGIAVTGALGLHWARWLDGRGGLDLRAFVRWARPAVVVAVLVPLAYAATRVAWALGIPLGISEQSLEELGSARYAGLGLGLFACVGAWLTWGLLARWGEEFWSWLPIIGGRPVPVALAVVPGLLVAGTVTSAGLSFWALLASGELSTVPGAVEDWAAWAPSMLWPLWGVALAVATLGYLGRRIGRPARAPLSGTSPSLAP